MSGHDATRACHSNARRENVLRLAAGEEPPGDRREHGQPDREQRQVAERERQQPVELGVVAGDECCVGTG